MANNCENWCVCVCVCGITVVVENVDRGRGLEQSSKRHIEAIWRWLVRVFSGRLIFNVKIYYQVMSSPLFLIGID